MRVGELYALLTLRAEEYTAGLAKAEVSANHFGGRATAAFANVAKKVLELGAVVSLAAIGVGIEATKLAEREERAEALIDAAYGRSATAVKKWAKDNSEALGVTAGEIDKSLSKWGVYAKGVGMSTQAAADAGTKLAERAAQISAVTGDSFDEVFTKLVKGVQGATRGLKNYGVAVDPISLAHEALRLHLIKSGQALDLHAKAVATESLLLKQTEPYVKAFGTAHNKSGFQAKQMGVIMEETMVAIGKAVAPIAAVVMPALAHAVQAASKWIVAHLPEIIAVFTTVFGVIGRVVSTAFTIIVAAAKIAIPVVQALLPVFKTVFGGIAAAIGGLADFVQANGPVIETVLGAIGGVLLAMGAAAVIGGIVALGGALATAFTMAAGSAALLVLSLSPIEIAVLAIGAVVGVFAVAWLNNWGNIREITANVVGAIGGIIGGVVDAIGGVIDWITGTAVPAVESAFGAISAAIGAAVKWVADTAIPIFEGAMNAIGAVIGVVATVIKVALTVVADVFLLWLALVIAVVGKVVDVLRPVATALFPLVGAAARLLGSVIHVAFNAIAAVIRFVAGVVQGILGVLAAAFGPVRVAAGAMSSGVGAVFGVMRAAVAVAVAAIGAVLAPIGRVVFPAVSAAAHLVGSAIGKVWDGIRTGTSVAWGAITTIIKGAINIIIGVVNGFIGFLDAIQIHVPEIGVGPVHTPKFDWNGLGIPYIPYLASGTPSFAGGLAIVGEAGPELVNLPAGARVRTSAETDRLMDRLAEGYGDDRGGQHVHLHVNGLVEAKNTNEVLQALRRASGFVGIAAAGMQSDG